jgi:hypothetical protein
MESLLKGPCFPCDQLGKSAEKQFTIFGYGLEELVEHGEFPESAKAGGGIEACSKRKFSGVLPSQLERLEAL